MVAWAVGLLFAFAFLFVVVWILVIATIHGNLTSGELVGISLILLVPASASALLAVFVAEGSRVAHIISLLFGCLCAVAGLALIPRISAPWDPAYVLLLLLSAVPAALLLTPKARSFYRSVGGTLRSLPASTNDRTKAYGVWGVVLFWLCGIPAIVLGMLSLKQARFNGGAKFMGRASIGLGALGLIVGIALTSFSLNKTYSPDGAVRPEWTPTTPEQVACAEVRDELADGTLFNRSSQHARDIHTKVITPLMGSAGTNSNFRRQQLIFALADWQVYVGNDSNRLTPEQILAELDGKCSSYGAPIGD